MIHLDTSFIVDLLREAKRGQQGRATRCLERMRQQRLGVSLFAVCELRAGVELSANPAAEQTRVESLLAYLGISYPDDRFAAQYARILAHLQRKKSPIATMDLLIATAALLDEAKLVTANQKHFDRIPGLNVIAY